MHCTCSMYLRVNRGKKKKKKLGVKLKMQIECSFFVEMYYQHSN